MARHLPNIKVAWDGIAFPGVEGNRMRPVMVYGSPLWMREQSWTTLMRLACARLLAIKLIDKGQSIADAGWIRGTMLTQASRTNHVIYQMRRELASVSRTLADSVENDRRGCYRVTWAPRSIRIDVQALMADPDFRVATPAKTILDDLRGPRAILSVADLPDQLQPLDIIYVREDGTECTSL